MNFREWSNPDNWDEDRNWRVYKPGEDERLDAMLRDLERSLHHRSYPAGHTNHKFPDWAFAQRPLYADEETIDLMVDHLERQFPVEFDEYDKQFLHSVGMAP